MRSRIFVLTFASALTLAAADKKLPIGQTSNELVEMSATVLTDRDAIQQELGADAGSDVVVARVTLRPVSDKPVTIDHDAFLLISDKDGQRSQPYEPGQLAGDSSLVVTQDGVRNGRGGVTTPWGGGIPGIHRRKQQTQPKSDTTENKTGQASTDAKPAADSDNDKADSEKETKENPVLVALKAKILPEKEISGSTSGLLYFQIEGKVKPKDLELRYKTPAGQLAVRFPEK